MTDTQITVDLVRFALVPWQVDSALGQRIAPIPGTWTLAPESLCRQGIKGLICCPNRECHHAALIPYDMGEIDNGALKLQAFQCANCGLLCNARLLEWDTKKLFCVAYQIERPNRTVLPRKEYLHAESREQAITYFCAGTGYQLDHVTKQKWRMVDAGLAIGYFGQHSDKDQINLSVD